jgi:predicted TPR repeat methyltransferase
MIGIATPNITLQLADHQASMERISVVMNRVGTQLSPAEFIETVSIEFQDLQTATEQTTENKFRLDISFGAFQKALSMARDARAYTQSILVLGCGRGFAGKKSRFASAAVEEVFGERPPEISTCDISPALLRNAEGGVLDGSAKQYDLIVCHSLLHFIPDLSSFFALAHRLLKSSGGLILSHEPNARFWRNPSCQSAISEFGSQRNGRSKTYLRAKSLLTRLRALPSGRKTFWDQLNDILIERHGFAGPLLENEIRRIVDVHRPEAIGGDFRIGFNGFDVQNLSEAYLQGFRLVFAETSEHLGYVPRHSLSGEWKAKEESLSLAYPLDGSVFTIYWTREAQR